MKQKTLTPQKSFSRMGLALFVMLVVTTLVQAVCSGVVNVMAMQGNNLYETYPWLIWAISFLPLYVAGVPIGLAMMRRLPAEENPETASLSVGKLLKYLVMSIGVMYAGNLIGTGLSSLFSGGSAENPLLNYVFDNSPLKVIVPSSSPASPSACSTAISSSSSMPAAWACSLPMSISAPGGSAIPSFFMPLST